MSRTRSFLLLALVLVGIMATTACSLNRQLRTTFIFSTHDDRLLVSRPLAMVLVNDADRGGAIEPENLERLYDLTPAQARLLVALVDGRRLADYAEEAGVSINTVKSHMKQIFEKTGENRQTDLVRRVLADPLSRRS